MVAPILVTGGTGTLGRAVVPKLASAGHNVRVLTRNPSAKGHVRGDLESGTGIAEAVAGMDAIVHLASAAHKPNTRRVDVDGTRRLLDAAKTAGTGHLLYVSIVGAGRLPTRYMRFKRDAEQVVMAGGVGWSILRATPFPEFTDQVQASRRWMCRAFQAVHAALLWFGDIRTLYAALGLLLVALRNITPRTAVITAGCALLALATVQLLATSGGGDAGLSFLDVQALGEGYRGGPLDTLTAQLSFALAFAAVIWFG
jgi:NAD(P)-dependent dehydrogenase (short-subunit alcohol dehydrogenase family)